MKCPQCGYDLGSSLLPARCPFCGHNFSNASDDPRGLEGARRAEEARAGADSLYSTSDARRLHARRHQKRAIIALVGVGVFVALGVFLLLHFNVLGAAAAPDVVGWNVERATEELEAYGCTVETLLQKDDGNANMVLAMEPEASELKRGDSVVLTISDARIMPEVIGLTQEQAVELLDEQGIVYDIKEEYGDEAIGTISKATSSAGTKLTTKTTVVLTLIKQRCVPDLSGKTEDEAVDALEEAGLSAKIVYVSNTDESKEGTCVGTNPAAGIALTKDSEVEVQIASSRTATLTQLSNEILAIVYNCDPRSSSIGANLRSYCASSWGAASDTEIWHGLVKRNQSFAEPVSSEAFQSMPRTLNSINSVSVAEDGTATCEISVTWDWSVMGQGYENISSTDTRTITLSFDSDNKLTAFYDQNTDIPLYEYSS